MAKEKKLHLGDGGVKRVNMNECVHTCAGGEGRGGMRALLPLIHSQFPLHSSQRLTGPPWLQIRPDGGAFHRSSAVLRTARHVQKY